MSTTTVQLLQAACEIAGGSKALAQQLGIGETLLWRFMTDTRELPDTLLLRAVDIILTDRLARLPGQVEPDGPADKTGALSPVPESPQNCARGNGAAYKAGGGG